MIPLIFLANVNLMLFPGRWLEVDGAFERVTLDYGPPEKASGAGIYPWITDIDGNGIAGLERTFDKRLARSGATLDVAIDVRVQAILRREDGEYIWVYARGVVISDRNRNPIRMAGSISSIAMVVNSLERGT